jgi:hypothetical protein
MLIPLLAFCALWVVYLILDLAIPNGEDPNEFRDSIPIILAVLPILYLLWSSS